MPVLDGYAAVRMIRNFELEHHLPRSPILALTASTLEDDVRKAIEAGCTAHVAKPIRKEILLAAIAAAIQYSRPGHSRNLVANPSVSDSTREVPGP